MTLPDAALPAKEKFVRTKPHVNVGTYNVADESVRVLVELVDTAAQVSGTPSGVTCGGTVDMRIEDASTGRELASRPGVVLSPGAVETLSHDVGSAAQLVRTVVIAHRMEVNGKTCVLRGRIEFVDLSDGRIRRSVPLRREDFVAVKALR